ncbi:MAG: hypothetical protein PVG66_14975 [Chromatiales bacterium]|jgi:hypothetical protein
MFKRKKKRTLEHIRTDLIQRSILEAVEELKDYIHAVETVKAPSPISRLPALRYALVLLDLVQSEVNDAVGELPELEQLESLLDAAKTELKKPRIDPNARRKPGKYGSPWRPLFGGG